MRLKSWHIKGYHDKSQEITYSLVNSVLLLKTPGGSSFIWLLPNSLREDILWFQLKVLFFLEIFTIAGFFILFFLLD